MWPRLRSWHQDQHCMRGQQPVSPEAWPEPPGIQCVGGKRGQQRAAFQRCLDRPLLPQPPQLLTPYLLPPNLRSPDVQ